MCVWLISLVWLLMCQLNDYYYISDSLKDSSPQKDSYSNQICMLQEFSRYKYRYRYIMYIVSNHCQYIPLNMHKVFLFCFVAIFSLNLRVFMWLIQPYFLDCCAWMTQWHGPERYGWNRLVPNYDKTKPSTNQYLILGMHCYWCAYGLWYWITWWKLSDIVFVRLLVNNQLQTILI